MKTYYWYDTIKNRRVAFGARFINRVSGVQLVALAISICSNQDNFNRKTARKIVNDRLDSVIKLFDNAKEFEQYPTVLTVKSHEVATVDMLSEIDEWLPRCCPSSFLNLFFQEVVLKLELNQTRKIDAQKPGRISRTGN
jgi:hypothetical protein